MVDVGIYHYKILCAYGAHGRMVTFRPTITMPIRRGDPVWLPAKEKGL